MDVEGGTRPYSYSISKETWQFDSVFAGLDEGIYHYRVTDSHNCMVDGDAEITKDYRDCGVWLPTAFSPNGDGKNDLFRVVVHDAVRDFMMAVYGRWGELIFKTTSPDQGWDGGYQGNQLPAGSYVYVVTYTNNKGQAMKQMGSLVIFR